MAAVIEFDVYELPALPNRMKGWHWAKTSRYRRDWHWKVRCALGVKPAEPIDPALVVLVRRSLREPDPDNLMASWKPIIDGLVNAGALVDDSPDHVTLFSRWEPAVRGEGSISVQVQRK